MHHFYERNIIEIKNEYTNFIIDIMTPILYETLMTLYHSALEKDCQLRIKMVKNNDTLKNTGIEIFQNYLKNFDNLSQMQVADETERIKCVSRCSEWFDDLVKAVIKSNIVLLTYNISDKTCDLVDQKYHEKISSNNFVHRCLMECAKIFYNNPEIIWKGFNKNLYLNETSILKTEIINMIKTSIHNAIRRLLPLKYILTEYLSNDYIVDMHNIPINKIQDIKKLVDRDIKHDSRNYTENLSDRSNKDYHTKKLTHNNKLSSDDKHRNSSEAPGFDLKKKQNSITTEDDIVKLNTNIKRLKDNIMSDTSDIMFNIDNKYNKSDTLLNIDVEHPTINKC